MFQIDGQARSGRSIAIAHAPLVRIAESVVERLGTFDHVPTFVVIHLIRGLVAGGEHAHGWSMVQGARMVVDGLALALGVIHECQLLYGHRTASGYVVPYVRAYDVEVQVDQLRLARLASVSAGQEGMDRLIVSWGTIRATYTSSQHPLSSSHRCKTVHLQQS